MRFRATISVREVKWLGVGSNCKIIVVGDEFISEDLY